MKTTISIWIDKSKGKVKCSVQSFVLLVCIGIALDWLTEWRFKVLLLNPLACGYSRLPSGGCDLKSQPPDGRRLYPQAIHPQEEPFFTPDKKKHIFLHLRWRRNQWWCLRRGWPYRNKLRCGYFVTQALQTQTGAWYWYFVDSSGTL